jgi:hypothetical protein
MACLLCVVLAAAARMKTKQYQKLNVFSFPVLLYGTIVWQEKRPLPSDRASGVPISLFDRNFLFHPQSPSRR